MAVFPVVGRPVERARERQEAFDRWVLPEIEVLLRVARSLTGKAEDAEDLVQETLRRAFRAMDTRFERRGALETSRGHPEPARRSVDGAEREERSRDHGQSDHEAQHLG